jgi:transposase
LQKIAPALVLPAVNTHTILLEEKPTPRPKRLAAMARSPFEIELSEEEAWELRSRAARYTVPHGEVLRAKIVLLAAEGKTNAEIARRLNCSLRTVALWRKRFFEQRLDGLRDKPRPGRPRRFPPEEVAQVKAIACELPKEHGLPLSRFSRAELHRLVVERGISEASASTIARWLSEDALKPWQHRSWVFPTDPDFLEKAGPVLDLYQGRWEGKLLHPGDFVVCADEKPSIQARARIHEPRPPEPGSRGQRVEHTYERRAPSPTWPRSTSGAEGIAGPGSSAARKRGAGSSRSTGSSGR